MNESSDTNAQLICPPKAAGSKSNEQLAYIASYDAVINKTYAFVAYKETDTKKGCWKLKIRSKETASTSIDPEHPIVRRKIAEAAKTGRDYFVMGFGMEPRGDDPRLVENRIYFDELLQPSVVELHLVTRNPDGSPTEKQVVRFDWPV